MLGFLERVPEYGSIMLVKGGSELLELELKLDEALGSKQISDVVGFCAVRKCLCKIQLCKVRLFAEKGLTSALSSLTYLYNCR